MGLLASPPGAPDHSGVQTQWLAPADYPELASDWRGLEARAEGSPFTSWAWVSTWLQMLPAGVATRVFRASDANGVMALGLLVDVPEEWKGRPFGRSSLQLQECGVAQIDEISVEYAGLLVRSGAKAQGYRALFTHLDNAWEGWRRFRVSATADGEWISATLPPRLLGYRVHRQTAYRVEFESLRSSGTPYVSALGRNLRHNLRQTLRAYTSAHGTVRVEVAADCETASAWLEGLRALHERRWRAKGKPGAFASTFFSDFHQTLLQHQVATGFVELVRVMAGDLVVAYLYMLRWRGVLYFYNCGLNYGAVPRYDSPGSLALAAYIQHCIDNGAEGFDFLGGEQAYKRRLSTHEGTLDWIEVRRRGWSHEAERLLAGISGRQTFGHPLMPSASH